MSKHNIVNTFDLEQIHSENWKHAKGIIHTRSETNSALAPRNYIEACYMPYKICEIKGYFIWWCTVHHQPFFICERERNKP